MLRKRRKKKLMEPEEAVEVPQTIDPSAMIFHFRLGPDECHQKLTGTCSLDKPPATGEQSGGEAGVHYCQRLYSWIEEYGFRWPVDIIKHPCGHYDFNDGQHRVCIAKKKGFEVSALVYVEEKHNCMFCSPIWDLKDDELR